MEKAKLPKKIMQPRKPSGGGWRYGVAAVVGVGIVVLLVKGKREAEPDEKPQTKPQKSASGTLGETARNFVNAKIKSALAVQRNYDIPYLFALAQWGLESGWGRSAPGNNFFGIKATAGWTGERQLLTTREFIEKDGRKVPVTVQRWFRKYPTWDHAVKDWAGVLKNTRYAGAFRYKNDPRAFAREVAKGGYATAPNYADTVIGLIDKIEKGIKNTKS